MMNPIIELASIAEDTQAMNYSEWDDKKLVSRFKKGDSDAFRELIQRYQSELIRYLCGWLADESFAKDLCQDVFMVLLEKPPHNFNLSNSIRPWLFRIARNKAIDYKRRQARSEPLEIQKHEMNALKTGSYSSTADMDLFTAEALESSLDRLPNELRDVIQMRYFGGLSFKEIATVYGVSLGVINGKVRKALGMLRAELNLHIKEITK